MPAKEIRVVMTGVPGSPWYARHFLDSDASPSAQGAMDAVAAFWGGIASQISSGVTITAEPEVPEYTLPDTVVSVGTATPFTITTGGGANPVPRAAQVSVRWQTNTFRGNRRILGHTYIPYVSEESNVAGGTVAIEYRNQVAGAAADLIEAGLVIASRVSNAFAPVTNPFVGSEWAVLRSRRD